MDTDQVWAIAMVKDEADIILETLTHVASEGVDGIAVIDNGSSDGTLELLHEARNSLLCPIWIYEDPEVGYFQSVRMTWLSKVVAKEGADWVIPFDADELWYCNDMQVAPYLRSLPKKTASVGARLWNHYGTDLDAPGKPFTSIVYKNPEAGTLPKMAFRPKGNFTVTAGNHGVLRKKRGEEENILFQSDASEDLMINIRHFPYRSFEQFLRKVINGGRAFEATDFPEDMGAHWRQYYTFWKNGGDEAIFEIYKQWFYFADPVGSGMVEDPAPFCRWAD